ncbi:phage baseplate assembly protein V [Ensifer sp.]|jgi:hypothetical protein|uniref:phage baseplate assembly protein V n=1 Tax=Ensifer sp. TaxID=1872086 RepID=UPI002E16821F|nr:phage baseplate assembly protein V [Ensifer sp.]
MDDNSPSWGFAEGMNIDGPSAASEERGGLRRYFGKHRGRVVQNIDPTGCGRLMVQVEDVWGPNFSSWALPCVPYAGPGLGAFVVPPLGAEVWVEFEHGNPDFPIWTGFFWGSQLEAPVTPRSAIPASAHWSTETITKHAMSISDTPVGPQLPAGGILLRAGQSYIAVSPIGIMIHGPFIAMNEAALIVK